jgi:hypothetical protein
MPDPTDPEEAVRIAREAVRVAVREVESGTEPLRIVLAGMTHPPGYVKSTFRGIEIAASNLEAAVEVAIAIIEDMIERNQVQL